MRLTIAFGLASVVLAALFFPLLLGPHVNSIATACLSNTKQLGLAMTAYAEDNDGTLPISDRWADAIQSRVSYAEAFIEPGPTKYQYAFNRPLGSSKPAVMSAATVMLFESTTMIRNASDPVTSLPNPGRHHGRNNVAYADGHVKAVTRQR